MHATMFCGFQSTSKNRGLKDLSEIAKHFVAGKVNVGINVEKRIGSGLGAHMRYRDERAGFCDGLRHVGLRKRMIGSLGGMAILRMK
jgi:hypothetical protein